MQNFEQVRRQLAADGFRTPVDETFVIGVELSLDGGRRHQAIFLSELHDDDRRCYLRVSTAVAPITGADARPALAMSWDGRGGYRGSGKRDDVPCVQRCEDRPGGGVDAAELGRLVLEIGGMGDRLERLLSADGDLL